MRRILKDSRGSIMVEFSICGLMFLGVVFGMIVTGLWIYNVSDVNQAARIAAYQAALTNNPVEAQNNALTYLNKTLIACPTRGTKAYCTAENGCGEAEAYMDPLFPGFQKLIDPWGTSTVNGKIHIRREAVRSREYRFRAGNTSQFN